MDNHLLNLLKKIHWPKKVMLFGVILSILSSLLSLILPIFAKYLVDNFKANRIEKIDIAVFIIVFILSNVINGFSIYLLSKMSEEIIYSIKTKLWNHMINLKISFFDNTNVGDLMSSITEDTSVINDFLSNRAPTTISSFLTLIGSIIILFILDWKMTLLVFIIIPLFLITIIPLSKKIGDISLDNQESIANLNSLLARVLYDIRLVKVSTKEPYEVNLANKNLKKLYNLGLKESLIRSIINPLSSFIMLITAMIIIGYGSIRLSTGDITIGTLVAMIFYLIQLTEPVLNLSLFIADYHKSLGASKRIYNIYNQPREDINNFKSKMRNINNIATINFKNVYFSYDNKKEILNNINFSISANQMTAIVGPSGSGKTTIFNLIVRFYETSKGNIYCNGESINKLDLHMWRNKIGYVMQDNTIMQGTIRDNLIYGIDSRISDEEILEYCKKAYVYDFIVNLPEKLDTVIGERGINLSGGQKQRIDIARNFIKQPDIFLFDEATSNLDSESENYIQKAMDNLSQRSTTIIIAHRLSTIKKAQKIIFLDEGIITGEGTHKELMETHQKYKKFVKSQYLDTDF